MAGTLHKSKNQQGTGHGSRNHRHASGNRLVCWYYGLYQAVLNPKFPRAAAARQKAENPKKKHQRNRNKQ